QSNQVALRLQQPTELVFSPDGTNSTWNVSVEPLVLAGDSREFQLTANLNWPHSGTFQCAAKNLDARLCKDFIPRANSDATLNHLDLHGGWTNGPIAFQLASDATLKTKEQTPFSATAILTGTETGLSIEQLSVTTATQAVCRLEGALPVSFDPTKQGNL